MNSESNLNKENGNQSLVFDLYNQYTNEILVLKSDLEDILKRVNSVNTNDSSDVQNLKE